MCSLMICKMYLQYLEDVTPWSIKSSILEMLCAFCTIRSMHFLVRPVQVSIPTRSVAGAAFLIKCVRYCSNLMNSSARTSTGSMGGGVCGWNLFSRTGVVSCALQSSYVHTIAHTSQHWWRQGGDGTLTSVNAHIKT